MRRSILRREAEVGLTAFIIIMAMTAVVVQAQTTVTMMITGTVRWGESRGQVTPEGYVKGNFIPGIDVIAFLQKGTDIHGLPINEILAQTKTDGTGRYNVTFSVSAAEKSVYLMAISSWGEARGSISVAAGKFIVDLSVDFGHLDYAGRPEQPTAWYDIAVLQIGASKVVVWHAILALIGIMAIPIGILVKRRLQR